MADRLWKVPEVSRVITLESFVPSDQQTKVAAIQKAAKVLDPRLAQAVHPPPSDKDNVAALRAGADALIQTAGEESGPGADAARRLAAAMSQLATAGPAMRAKAQATFVSPLKTALDSLRSLLQAEPVTGQNIPPDFAADWIKPDGRARIQVFPRGDPNDNEVLRQFAQAVLVAEPTASGGPLSILEASFGRSLDPQRVWHSVSTVQLEQSALASVQGTRPGHAIRPADSVHLPLNPRLCKR